MDQLTSQGQTSSIVALFAIVLIVSAVLVGVVLIQNRKIKDMQRPKYGFLGKPLNAFVLLAVMLGGLGFVYYSTTNRTNQFVDVSADSVLATDIIITQVDSVNRTYKFNAIPTIDSVEWGGSSIYLFDIYWTISNGDVYSPIEYGVNNLNDETPGGIVADLKQGTYKVKVTIFIDDKMTDMETTLEVE